MRCAPAPAMTTDVDLLGELVDVAGELACAMLRKGTRMEMSERHAGDATRSAAR